MARKPRKTAKQREAEVDALRIVQAESHAQAVREAVGIVQPSFNLDAAARVAYESVVRQLGLKIGQKVSDASGVHRIPSWEQHKSFVKDRWCKVAQDVLNAGLDIKAQG